MSAVMRLSSLLKAGSRTESLKPLITPIAAPSLALQTRIVRSSPPVTMRVPRSNAAPLISPWAVQELERLAVRSTPARRRRRK